MTSFWTAKMPEGDGQRRTGTQVRYGGADSDSPHAKRSTQEIILDELKTITKTAFFTTAVQPFNLAQVLMQIGYEPFPARPGVDIFGRSAYYLPSVLDYLQHIRKEAGFKGLFLGLGPTLGVVIGGIYAYKGSERLVKYIYDEWYLGRPVTLEVKRFGFLEPADVSGRSSNAMEFGMLRFEPKETVGISYTAANFAEDLLKEISVVSLSMAATWPLQVIAFRTMAQFVGGEKLYDGLIGSIQEIANTEGLSGFFRGLFPMWYSYVSVTSVTYIAVFAYASYNTTNPINLRLVAAAAGAVANSFFYPLKLTARLFAINGARLAAARPPVTPHFAKWRDLHNYLVLSGESKRGSSMIFRKVTGPKVPNKADTSDWAPPVKMYRTHMEKADNWHQKSTSMQLMSRHTSGLRFVF
ncbi:mitochondrial carrier homolog 2-like [Paramacrobiotus metropolitanus]|uniref:mitochondrial carrier homolog 2-like n=1 Tax=Paramacrobiotus metropolitanus TaxID=2943436 RepID=UPI002445C8D0|nr:mitochondrial carrier homolog 2-like [Paramacrobiotus metropolitanus]XP_055343006.1 mitochondrial carrier homolog 2-like [Paramacrobiotus metropolitanus]